MSEKYIGTESGHGLIGPVMKGKPSIYPEDCEPESKQYIDSINAWDAYNQHLASLTAIPCDGWRSQPGQVYELGVHFIKDTERVGPFSGIVAIQIQPKTEKAVGLTMLPLEKPVGDFIIENAKGVAGKNGTYYHYSEVVQLLKKWKKTEPTYPGPFIEWVFDNCILLEGSWYMWKKGHGEERPGGEKFTLAELFAGPYERYIESQSKKSEA